MGIHTAEPTVGRQRYIGIGYQPWGRAFVPLPMADRYLSTGATREICEDDLPSKVKLQDLGEHPLKDLDRPEHLYQLVIDGLAGEFPPPRTGESSAAATELADVSPVGVAGEHWCSAPLSSLSSR